MIRLDIHAFFDKIKFVEDCWLWQHRLDKDGYGMFSSYRMHRWSYETFRDSIPAENQIDHLCRVRNCVNPWHLEIVTSIENTLRAIPFRAVKIFCKRGHRYEEGETKNHGCYKCKRDRMYLSYKPKRGRFESRSSGEPVIS